jgi:hypothetical protein
METSDQAVVAALRRLTLAVWVLVAVVVLSSAASLFMRPSVIVPPAARPEIPRGVAPPGYEHQSFHDNPLDKQIQAASVIAVAKYEKEGDRLKCMIGEILKQAPDTEFYYKVGDEYEMCGRVPKGTESYGDGQVMFFVGNPAEFRYSTSYSGNRMGRGDIPLDVLRQKIKAASR